MLADVAVHRQRLFAKRGKERTDVAVACAAAAAAVAAAAAAAGQVAELYVQNNP